AHSPATHPVRCCLLARRSGTVTRRCSEPWGSRRGEHLPRVSRGPPGRSTDRGEEAPREDEGRGRDGERHAPGPRDPRRERLPQAGNGQRPDQARPEHRPERTATHPTPGRDCYRRRTGVRGGRLERRGVYADGMREAIALVLLLSLPSLAADTYVGTLASSGSSVNNTTTS